MNFKTQLNRNLILLFFCQALSVSGQVLIFTVTSLISLSMDVPATWITLPYFITAGSAMVLTLPISMLMKKLGRKSGFMIASLVSILAAVLSAWAIVQGSFLLFCLSSVLFGYSMGSAPYFRFAAMEVAEDKGRSEALSLILAGGVVAAFLGPFLADLAKDLAFVPYLGNMLIYLALPVIIIGLLTQIEFPEVIAEDTKPARPLREVLANGGLLLGILSGMISYGVMSLLMAATPIAMDGCGFSFTQITQVIRWHLLGMFLPAFFTGHLIARIGAVKVILLGGLFNLGCVAWANVGLEYQSFLGALVLLGIGWNFMYTGASVLLSESAQPNEQAMVQGVNEFFVMGATSLSFLATGFLLDRFGWFKLNLMSIPLVFGVMGFALLAKIIQRQNRLKAAKI